jgi:hypothetical protein
MCRSIGESKRQSQILVQPVPDGECSFRNIFRTDLDLVITRTEIDFGEDFSTGRVSFNPNPPKLPPRITGSSLSIPTKRREIQTSRDTTTILESSRTTPNHLEDWIPKNNEYNEVVEGEMLLLESVSHSRNLESSLKNKNQGLNFRKRERERSSNFGSQCVICFFEWPTAQGGRWGSIYSPHLKKSHWGEFSPD